MRYLLLCLLALSLPVSAAQNLRILLTNDDGYDSAGIQAVHKALINAGHDVYLIAPAKQQSGASASVSSRGVKVTAYPGQVWAVEGRPADAVRVGLGNIMFNEPPDLVVSGANFGQNTGQDVNISGTVGAAITAYRLGVPAIALSVGIKLEEASTGFPSTAGAFTGAARTLVRLIRNMKLTDLTSVLNVNYPAVLPLDVRGVRWAELSDHSLFGKRYNRQADGRYTPEFVPPAPSSRAHDAEALEQGFVTLTFLDGDMSVSTKRNQRYLDNGLLDRSYEPTTQPPQSRMPPAEKASMPPPRQTTTLESRKPADAALNMDVPKAPAPATIATQPTENEENQENQETVEPAKPKPDSWLRRMFSPSSWRR